MDFDDDELDFYSLDEIEDMELRQDADAEGEDLSDTELMENLASVVEINEYEADPHLEGDKHALQEMAERRGLMIYQVGDEDWKCEICGAVNAFDCGCCQGCGEGRGSTREDK
jgi:hypothetical protein